MISFLLVLSLILHGITIIAVITLSLRVAKAKELEVKQEKVAKEIEDLFTAYLLEVKEENQQLMNMLENKGNNDINQIKQSFYKQNEDRKADTHVSKKPIDINKKKDVKSVSNESYSYQPPQIEEYKDIVEQSLESKVFRLFDQGNSMEEIAKKLNCGKTEIELILKFHPRKS